MILPKLSKGDILALCKVYKGEKEVPNINPYPRYRLYWMAEKLFFVRYYDDDFVRASLQSASSLGYVDSENSIFVFLCSCLFARMIKGTDIDPREFSIYFRDVILPEYLALPQI